MNNAPVIFDWKPLPIKIIGVHFVSEIGILGQAS